MIMVALQLMQLKNFTLGSHIKTNLKSLLFPLFECSSITWNHILLIIFLLHIEVQLFYCSTIEFGKFAFGTHNLLQIRTVHLCYPGRDKRQKMPRNKTIFQNSLHRNLSVKSIEACLCFYCKGNKNKQFIMVVLISSMTRW